MASIEAMISAAAAAAEAQGQAERDRREAERRAFQQEQLEQLEAAWNAATSPAFREALEDVELEALGEHHNPANRVYFLLDGVRWQLSYYASGGQWTLNHPYVGERIDWLEGRKLESTLLLAMAAWRQLRAAQIERERAQAAAAEADEEKRRAGVAAMEARLAAEWAEHQACEGEIAELVAEARAELWRWPAGRELTVYRWKWMIGASRAGEPIFDTGWSLTDQADARGYVQLQYDRWGSPREIRLTPEVHRPTVERETWAAARSDFLRPVEIRIEGYVLHDGRWRRAPGAVTTHEIGRVPLPWIIEALER